MEKIIFGGGCFWCTEAIFRKLRGVVTVIAGYAGGGKPNPTYYEVCSGATGHAEVVQIEYDSSSISLRDLLTVFFATHDPTTPNRQGADVGEQYRSVIFYTNAAQKEVIDHFILEINNSTPEGHPIVTEVNLLDRFWPAEADHQDYYEKNPQAMYCAVVINPKLEKVQQHFSYLLKDGKPL